MIRLLFLLFLVGCSDDLVNNDLIEPIKNLIVQIDRPNNELYIQVEASGDLNVNSIDSVMVNLKYVGGIGLDYERNFLLYDNGEHGDIIPDNGIYTLIAVADTVGSPDEQAEIISVNFPNHFRLDDTEYDVIPFTIIIKGKKYLATVNLFENNNLHTSKKYLNIDNTNLEIQINKSGLYIDDLETEVCDRVWNTYENVFYPITFEWPDAESSGTNDYFMYESGFMVESMEDCGSTGIAIFKFVLNDLDTEESMSEEKSLIIFGCGDEICEYEFENINTCPEDCQ